MPRYKDNPLMAEASRRSIRSRQLNAKVRPAHLATLKSIFNEQRLTSGDVWEIIATHPAEFGEWLATLRGEQGDG